MKINSVGSSLIVKLKKVIEIRRYINDFQNIKIMLSQFLLHFCNFFSVVYFLLLRHKAYVLRFSKANKIPSLPAFKIAQPAWMCSCTLTTYISVHMYNLHLLSCIERKIISYKILVQCNFLTIYLFKKKVNF